MATTEQMQALVKREDHGKYVTGAVAGKSVDGTQDAESDGQTGLVDSISTPAQQSNKPASNTAPNEAFCRGFFGPRTLVCKDERCL